MSGERMVTITMSEEQRMEAGNENADEGGSFDPEHPWNKLLIDLCAAYDAAPASDPRMAQIRDLAEAAFRGEATPQSALHNIATIASAAAAGEPARGRCGVAECPCNDGDPCNYEDLPGSPAMPLPAAADELTSIRSVCEPLMRDRGWSCEHKGYWRCGGSGIPFPDAVCVQISLEDAQAAAERGGDG